MPNYPAPGPKDPTPTPDFELLQEPKSEDVATAAAGLAPATPDYSKLYFSTLDENIRLREQVDSQQALISSMTTLTGAQNPAPSAPPASPSIVLCINDALYIAPEAMATPFFALARELRPARVHPTYHGNDKEYRLEPTRTVNFSIIPNPLIRE